MKYVAKVNVDKFRAGVEYDFPGGLPEVFAKTGYFEETDGVRAPDPENVVEWESAPDVEPVRTDPEPEPEPSLFGV